MAKRKLNPKIVKKLSNKLRLSENTIRQSISNLRHSYASCTLNAVAQLYAMKKGLTVMQQLSPEDKASIPHIEITKSPKIEVKKKAPVEKIKPLINYETTDHFIKGHVHELNRAYTYKCYTGAYILSRKIIENLILDILKKKYPENSKENKELYWDISQKRFKDFSVILKNLYNKKDEFSGTASKAIERLYQLAKKFKEDGNDKTHSWFHLVNNAAEINSLDLQAMLELIKAINK